MVVLERGSLSYERSTPVLRHSLGGVAYRPAVLVAKCLFLSLKGAPARSTPPSPPRRHPPPPPRTAQRVGGNNRGRAAEGGWAPTTRDHPATRARAPSKALGALHALHTAPHTLHPTPFTLHPRPCTPDPAPHSLHPTPFSLHHAPRRKRRVRDPTLNPRPKHVG